MRDNNKQECFEKNEGRSEKKTTWRVVGDFKTAKYLIKQLMLKKKPDIFKKSNIRPALIFGSRIGSLHY